MRVKKIYHLYYIENGTKVPFYVGETEDPNRRLKEHQYGAIKSHEDKYKFIRELRTNDIDFHMEVIREIHEDENTLDCEAFYLIKFINAGYDMQNMKAGNRVAFIKDAIGSGKTFKSVSDVTKFRLEMTEPARIEKLRDYWFDDGENEKRFFQYVDDIINEAGWENDKKMVRVEDEDIQCVRGSGFRKVWIEDSEGFGYNKKQAVIMGLFEYFCDKIPK